MGWKYGNMFLAARQIVCKTSRFVLATGTRNDFVMSLRFHVLTFFRE